MIQDPCHRKLPSIQEHSNRFLNLLWQTHEQLCQELCWAQSEGFRHRTGQMDQRPKKPYPSYHYNLTPLAERSQAGRKAGDSLPALPHHAGTCFGDRFFYCPAAGARPHHTCQDVPGPTTSRSSYPWLRYHKGSDHGAGITVNILSWGLEWTDFLLITRGIRWLLGRTSVPHSACAHTCAMGLTLCLAGV